MTFIKVCGVTRRQDVDAAAGLGVDALGFILVEGSPRLVPLERAVSLAESVPAGIHRVAVMMNPSPGELAEAAACGAFDLLQLHGEETPEMVEGAGIDVIKALSVSGPADLERAAAYGAARYFLFDSRKREMAKGSAFDHALLSGRTFARPFILAGGLGPDNLRDAIALVRPFGVDLNSGVEDSPGVKDIGRLEKAVAVVRGFDETERGERR